MHSQHKIKLLNVQSGVFWASDKENKKKLPITKGLMVDLNADFGITVDSSNRISSWENQVVENEIDAFVKQDEGRTLKGSGMPRLKKNVPELNGHNAVIFHRQELVNHNEDAFDHLTKGSGFTWFAIISIYDQVIGKPGVNAFFGNLRNTNIDKKGEYEGVWAGVSDENQIWIGARNALEKGLWHKNSPHVLAPEPLKSEQYYLIIGKMESGQGNVPLELFINSDKPIASAKFPVSEKVNPSKMVIGQERDATNYPGFESFDGAIARFLIYDRPLANNDLNKVIKYLNKTYNIK
ncbi:hypothetical protein PW52_01850 [Tamlana sedimentorum]|uniref:LamG-like jellyroll fold domain-containing protein n=1 Tax=Neotamlana sedimentorum TaxID=1435349 RepID=A0A0D7WDK4_9FLAO|nr:hypothetical protein PW52_01850 [Tamlana sedimentorum]